MPTAAPPVEYLDAFSKRREIVAQSSGKYELLGSLAPAIRDAHGALVFTETVRAANHAINRLDPLVSIDLITGSTARRQRREILDDLRVRRLDAVAAPRVLDEGVDVPDANLGIVMSASRTRRQMIQRMGRILRRKQPGVAARFVIMFAKDTLEDPTQRVERDGFLDEIERISDATGVFDGAPLRRARHVPRRARPRCRARTRALRPPRRRGSSEEFARIVVARCPRSTAPNQCAELDAPSRTGHRTSPYLELTLSNLPEIAKPKVRAEAAVDRSGAARDRAGRVGLADHVHGLRRGRHRWSSSGGRSSTRRSLPLRLSSRSGADGVEAAVDVDLLAGGGGEPVGEQRDARLGDRLGVLEVPARAAPARPRPPRTSRSRGCSSPRCCGTGPRPRGSPGCPAGPRSRAR